MLLADGLRAIVGSINLAPGSFDDRRELAIEVHDDDIVERLHKVANHDWETLPSTRSFRRRIVRRPGKSQGRQLRNSGPNVDKKKKKHKK